MHAMMYHVQEFMELYGSLLPFTQQGLEKYNDVMTKQYFRSSNHRGTEALRQIMQKQNRIDYLKDKQVQPARRFTIKCSNCDQVGHNKSTCMAACKKCNVSRFRLHLVTVDSKRVPQCEHS